MAVGVSVIQTSATDDTTCKEATCGYIDVSRAVLKVVSNLKLTCDTTNVATTLNITTLVSNNVYVLNGDSTSSVATNYTANTACFNILYTTCNLNVAFDSDVLQSRVTLQVTNNSTHLCEECLLAGDSYVLHNQVLDGCVLCITKETYIPSLVVTSNGVFEVLDSVTITIKSTSKGISCTCSNRSPVCNDSTALNSREVEVVGQYNIHICGDFTFVDVCRNCCQTCQVANICHAISKNIVTVGNINGGLFPIINLYLKLNRQKLEVLGSDSCCEVISLTHLECHTRNGRNFVNSGSQLSTVVEFNSEVNLILISCVCGNREALVGALVFVRSCLSSCELSNIAKLESYISTIEVPFVSVVSLCEVNFTCTRGFHCDILNYNTCITSGKTIGKGEFNLRKEVLELHLHGLHTALEQYAHCGSMNTLFSIDKVLGTFLVSEGHKTKTKFCIFASSGGYIPVVVLNGSQSCEVVVFLRRPVLDTVVTPNITIFGYFFTLKYRTVGAVHKRPNVKCVEVALQLIKAGVLSRTSCVVNVGVSK